MNFLVLLFLCKETNNKIKNAQNLLVVFVIMVNKFDNYYLVRKAKEPFDLFRFHGENQ